eukprot:CFRG5452T1
MPDSKGDQTEHRKKEQMRRLIEHRNYDTLLKLVVNPMEEKSNTRRRKDPKSALIRRAIAHIKCSENSIQKLDYEITCLSMETRTLFDILEETSIIVEKLSIIDSTIHQDVAERRNFTELHKSRHVADDPIP